MRRMVAKLRAFLTRSARGAADLPGRRSVAGRYARAIAHYRLPDLRQALADIDALLAEHPDDPYFHELKGQMLFENGRIADAIAPYREAVRLAPGAPLIRVGLAQALIETGRAGNSEAVAQLEEVTRSEPDNAGAWRLLGVARGRDGLQGGSDWPLPSMRCASASGTTRASTPGARKARFRRTIPRGCSCRTFSGRSRRLRPGLGSAQAAVSAAKAHRRASVTLSTQPSTRITPLREVRVQLARETGAQARCVGLCRIAVLAA